MEKVDSKPAKKEKSASMQGGDVSGASLMADPTYLRQSSALINEALQKGFDVMQLANGDIVTTGTKIVVSTYAWDAAKGRLVKSRTGRMRQSVSQDVMESDFAEEDA